MRREPGSPGHEPYAEAGISGEHKKVEAAAQEEEREGAPEFEVLQVPSLIDESGAAKEELRKEAQVISDVERKIVYLEDLLKDASSRFPEAGKHTEILTKYAEFVRSRFEAYKSRIEKYPDAPDASAVIPTRIEKVRRLASDEEAERDEILSLLRSDFESRPGNKVCLCDSHVSTIYDLMAAYESRTNTDAKIGVMVFDNHIDLYTKGGTHEWKGNVFERLFSRGVIERATFIGGLELPQTLDRANNTLGSQGDVFDQISAKSIRTDEKIDRAKLLSMVKERIFEYKKAGITNMVFSIDIDVLRAEEMGYTAMEYNPMNVLGYLASVRLPTRMDSQDDYKNFIHKLRNGGMRTSPLSAMGSYNPQGLRLGDIGVCLDIIAATCREEGLELGVQLTGGGKYLGDVVELYGPDIDERTTRATSALIKRLNKISDSLSAAA